VAATRGVRSLAEASSCTPPTSRWSAPPDGVEQRAQGNLAFSDARGIGRARLLYRRPARLACAARSRQGPISASRQACQQRRQLAECADRVVARRPATLRIVGRGRSRQRKELLRRIRKLGLEAHVRLEPAVPHHEVPAVLASADLALAPLGYNERNVVQGCCPLKVLEYLACGRPVVTSNLPVVRELVREERDALLVTPDAPDALAAAVLRLLDDPRTAQRLAEHGARHVRASFTWKRAQKRLLDVYARLLQQENKDAP